MWLSFGNNLAVINSFNITSGSKSFIALFLLQLQNVANLFQFGKFHNLNSCISFMAFFFHSFLPGSRELSRGSDFILFLLGVILVSDSSESVVQPKCTDIDVNECKKYENI